MEKSGVKMCPVGHDPVSQKLLNRIKNLIVH